MKIHLIRHAHAGSRKGWDGDDVERPLSSRGREQAAAIGDALAEAGIDLLLSSAYVRCVQTLEPLADITGRPIQVADPLTEGGGGAEALDQLLRHAAEGRTVAACSHGDVIPAVVATALGRGAELVGTPSPSKGARYVLTVHHGKVTKLVHVPPPDRED